MTEFYQQQFVVSQTAFVFHRLKNDTLLARAETEWVFVNANSGKPRRLLDEVMSRFDVIEDDRQIEFPE